MYPDVLKVVKGHLKAWDLKARKGEAEICVPEELPSPPEGGCEEALRRWFSLADEYWSAYRCEKLEVPAAYDGRAIVYNPSFEGDATKYLIAAAYEHYLNHKLQGKLKRLWEKGYLYFLSKTFGRLKALEVMRLSYALEDPFDAAALAAAAPRPGAGELEVKMFPSEKVKVALCEDAELEEKLEKVILERPDFEKRLVATYVAAGSRRFTKNLA